MYQTTIKSVYLETDNRNSFKTYRIKNGEIQIMFRGKWREVEETNQKETDNRKTIYSEIGIKSLQAGTVKVRNWN